MGEPADAERDSRPEAPELTRESLDGGNAPRRRWPTRWRALNVLSLLAACALAVFLIAGGIIRMPGSITSAPTVRTLTPYPTATPVLTGGWVRTGPGEAQTIVFAPSDPTTAYTCGVSRAAADGGAGPLVIGVSHDGGATWRRLPVPAAGAACWLTVNPTAADDLVLQTSLLAPVGGTATVTLYRSFDGGRSWRPFPAPPRGGPDAGVVSWHQWAWTGDALYVAPYYDGENGYTRLAISAGGSPFRWLDTDALFAGPGHGASINRIFGSSQSLYVEVNQGPSACTTRCFVLRRSRDGGASWQDFAPRLDGNPINVVDAQPGRQTLFGQYDIAPDGSSRAYARSEDDGATWLPLPPLPNNDVVALSFVETPSGAIYVSQWSFDETSSSSTPLGIYTLPFGSPDWRYVAPDPTGGAGLFAVAWDTRGAPLAIWAPSSPPSASGPAVGLARHAP